MLSEAQRKATKKYQLKNTKSICLSLSRKYDTDIIEFLETLPNKNSYLKELIRKDIPKR